MPQFDNPQSYDTFADYYDCSDVNRLPEIDFYVGLIHESDQSLLELACGTGTITGKMADQIGRRHGRAARIVGVDNSSRMLELARSSRPDIEWVLGDMRGPPVSGPFDLIICPFNSLQLLLDLEDLRRTFEAVGGLLSDSGRFIFQVYNPNFAALARRLESQVVRRFIDGQGRHLELLEKSRYDASNGIVHLDWQVQDADQSQDSWLKISIKQYLPEEIECCLNNAGLEIRARCGDVQKSAFEAGSRYFICECAKFGERRPQESEQVTRAENHLENAQNLFRQTEPPLRRTSSRSR